MADGFVLKRATRDGLLKLLAKDRAASSSPRELPDGPPRAGDEGGYVVRIPPGGLPALSEGADTGTGTGTGSVGGDYGDDVPGYAMCPAYRIVHPVGSSPYFLKLGFSLMVYNLSLVPVKAGRWLKVTRDRFGFYTYDNGLTPRSCS